VKRAHLKGQLTRINNFLIEKQDITYTQAEARQAKLEELWASFNYNETQLETLRIKEQLEVVMKEEERKRINFENLHFQATENVLL